MDDKLKECPICDGKGYKTSEECWNDIIANRRPPQQGQAEKLRELVKIQSSKGNYAQDEYMRGMANGLICALSVFTGEEPKYHEPPICPPQQSPAGMGLDERELSRFLADPKKVHVGFYPRGIRGAMQYTQERLAGELAQAICAKFGQPAKAVEEKK